MRFGRYDIQMRLAAGGMGEVFRARLVGEAGFEKPVALKRIFPHLSKDPHYRELFIREAKVTAHLVHPNIVQVYELGTEAGQLFIAMEFVDGTDFASLISHLHGQSDGPEATLLALVCRDVLEGLAFAHGLSNDQGKARNIVHRDISPQNILLSTGGIAKICDFGIARGSVSDTGGTDIFNGRRVGKLAFMPPEQIRGERVDGRADLFALGVTLWVGLTGQRFYPDDAVAAILLRGETIPQPRLRDFVPHAPPELVAIIEKAVQLDASRRYQSAAEFAEDLDRFIVARGAIKTREALREVVRDMRHTVIHRPLDEASGDVLAEISDTVPDRPPRQTEVDTDSEAATNVSVAPVAAAVATPAKEAATVLSRPQHGQGASLDETVLARHAVPVLAAETPDAAAQTDMMTVGTHRAPGPSRRLGLVAVTVGVVSFALATALLLRPTTEPPRSDAPAAIASPVAAALASPTQTPTPTTAAPPVAVEFTATPTPTAPAANPDPEPALVADLAPVPATSARPAGRTPAAAAKTTPPPAASRAKKSSAPTTGGKGYLTLESRPWAYISIDGRDLGVPTPIYHREVAAGRRKVTLQSADGKSRTLVLDIKDGETVNKTVDLD